MKKNKEKLRWHTESRRVGDLIPYEKNPRTITEAERQQLTESLKKFGLAEIPVINTDGKIAAGHRRAEILIALGQVDEMIDVRVPNRKLTKEEFREYLLRSNKNTGSWDWEGLKEFDIDELLKVGFEDEDLGFMWDDVNMIEEDDFDVEKEIKQIKEPKSRVGDLYQLGDHRLAVGDATSPQDVKNLMGEALADMIYCDPPYNIGFNYATGRKEPGGKYKGKAYGGSYSNKKDSQSDEKYREFIGATISNALSKTKNDAHIMYWCDERYIWLIQTIYNDHKLKGNRVCLWIKNNFTLTPQVAFNKAYEACVYGTKGSPFLNKKYHNLHEILNREIESGTQVFDEIQEIFNIWLAQRDQQYDHPTQKPLSLHEKPMKRCTKVGDVVMDLFGGSGSTLISCEQLKRKCYTIEIDPVFADVIINRWEKFTGKKAVKL